MFELSVEGDPSIKKWIVVQGNGAYSVGTFDGKRFVQEGDRKVCDIGPNFYATQSWANTETGDGRRIQAAWMRGSVFPNMPFSQQISFPCLLTLHRTDNGYRLHREPIQEVSKLYGKTTKFKVTTLDPGQRTVLAGKGESFRILCDVDIALGAALEFDVRGQKFLVECQRLMNGAAQGEWNGPVRHLDVLADRGSIEVFVNHGELSSTRYSLFDGEGLAMRAVGGQVTVRSLQVTALKGVWN